MISLVKTDSQSTVEISLSSVKQQFSPLKQNVSIMQADKLEAAFSSLDVMRPQKSAASVDNQSQQPSNLEQQMKTFLQRNDCSQTSSMDTIFTAIHSIMKLSEREAEYQLERNAG